MKKKQYFDEAAFDKFCNKLKDADQRFNEAVAALRAEGMDVSVKELSTYPKRFDDFNTGEGWAYRRHFNALCDEAMKRTGWLPVEEKERMRRSFTEVCKRTTAHAQTIVNFFCSGYRFADTPDGAVIDIEATEEAKRPDYIHDVNADAMAQHWTMLQEIRDKITALNDFNSKHGIPRVTAPGIYDFGAFARYILSTPDQDGNVFDLTQEQHDKSAWEFFKVKKQ